MNNNVPTGLLIRQERPEDFEGIRQVNQAAFDGPGEAHVVDLLRENCAQILSLVAIQAEQVVGHILFSPVNINQKEGMAINGMGLGPLAVRPDYQGRGIGSTLCQEGMNRMAQAGTPFVVVLGHPTYYPRFGFSKASTYGISSAYADVPEDAFMIAIFDEDGMAGVTGTAYYRPEFDSIT